MRSEKHQAGFGILQPFVAAPIIEDKVDAILFARFCSSVVYMNMKTTLNVRRIALATVAAAVLLVVAGLAYVRTHAPHPGMPEYSRILQAATAYKTRSIANGQAVPVSVSLQQLISSGLVRSSEVAGFEGLQVTVSLRPDETRPQGVLMSVAFPDGEQLVALGDGSIQQRASNPVRN